MRWLSLCCCVVACWAGTAWAQSIEVRVPNAVIAGTATTVSTAGSGKATLYLIGPGVSRKSEVQLGAEIQIGPEETQRAGAYQVVVCSDTCGSATFYVSAAKPYSLTFLVHPSRVPVAQGDAVSGVAFPFDQFRNLVLTPVSVNFQLTTGSVVSSSSGTTAGSNNPKASVWTRTVRSKDGIAWFRTASGRAAGALQVVASFDDVFTRRVVQQVASDPCNLRIQGQRTPTGILVQTEPVHDCSGNPVPDGTIVTFTATDAAGKSTVDAPIKQGIARAQITGSGSAVISVASGVVMGNELRVGAQ
jgi:hypothetical protein